MRNWSCPLQNKAHIRKELRKQRRTFSVDQRQLAAEMAAALLAEHSVFQQSNTIATYLGTPDEFDSLPIIQKIWQAHKKCYLPMLIDPEKSLEFRLYNENDKLFLNRYQILEPVNTVGIPVEKLDLVLMPLVGFDLQGHRLGMGGGYYDRTFEFLLKKQNLHKTPKLIGLAYSEQQVEHLPHDSWDVPLDGVLTEKKLIEFRS